MGEIVCSMLVADEWFATKEEACDCARRLALEKNVETEAFWDEGCMVWKVGENSYSEVENKKKYLQELRARYGNPFDLVNDMAAQGEVAAARDFHERHEVIFPSGETRFVFNRRPPEPIERVWYEEYPTDEVWRRALKTSPYDTGITLETQLNLAYNRLAEILSELSSLERLSRYDKLKRWGANFDEFDEQMRIAQAWKERILHRISELKARIPPKPKWYTEHPDVVEKRTRHLKVNPVGISSACVIRTLEDRLQEVANKIKELQSMSRAERKMLTPSYREQSHILKAWVRNIEAKLELYR